MPSRLFNLNIFLLLPLIVGILGRFRNYIWAEISLLIVILFMLLGIPAPIIPFLPLCAALLATGAMLQYGLDERKQILIGIGLVFLCFLALIKTLLPVILGHHHSPNRLLFIALILFIACGFLSAKLKEKWQYKWTGWTLRGITLSLLLFGTATFLTSSAQRWQDRRLTEHPVLEAMRRGHGIALTCSDIGLIQLRTRRPVLLDGHGLDGFIYAPEAAPTLDRILKKIYGVDFLHPTEDIKYSKPGALLKETGRKLWEERTLEEWQSIGKEFAVTQILTYSNWKLNLPVVISGSSLTLYSIPPAQ